MTAQPPHNPQPSREPNLVSLPRITYLPILKEIHREGPSNGSHEARHVLDGNRASVTRASRPWTH